MYRYAIKRIVMLVPVLFGVSFIVCAIMSFMPGDPARLTLGARATPEAIARLDRELGVDAPFLTRYFNYMKNVLSGDFGRSYRTGRPVASEIRERFPTTLKLACMSVFFAIALGVPLGVMAAANHGSWVDGLCTAAGLGFISIPPFWLGLLLITAFSLKLGWLPPFGSESLRHFILPAITNSSGAFAGILRMTRSAMLDALGQEYVLTAAAKGATRSRIIFRHCFRNALTPLAAVIGVNLGGLFGGSVITESVFGMSGIGNLLVVSVRSLDAPAAAACAMLLAAAFGVTNLAADIAGAISDPRVRARYER
jgi:peptide/nickel transport system permease protein